MLALKTSASFSLHGGNLTLINLFDTKFSLFTSSFLFDAMLFILSVECFRFCPQKTLQFIEELQRIIPNSEIFVRRGYDLKKIIPEAAKRGFTALIVVNEDKKVPSILYRMMN